MSCCLPISKQFSQNTKTNSFLTCPHSDLPGMSRMPTDWQDRTQMAADARSPVQSLLPSGSFRGRLPPSAFSLSFLTFQTPTKWAGWVLRMASEGFRSPWLQTHLSLLSTYRLQATWSRWNTVTAPLLTFLGLLSSCSNKV